MGGVPSIPTDPSRKLQVIGAGYSRTGTMTMQLALEKLLDGPVMHGGTQILAREDAYTRKWVEAYEAKRAGDKERTHKLLRELMAGFVGCTDMPAFDFVPELMDIYPDAKVVVTTRDPERWLESVRPIANNATLWWLPCAMWPVPGLRWFPALAVEFGRSAQAVIGDGGTDSGPTTRLLLNWNELVRQMVPPEKVLFMNLNEGWEPLCRFLHVPIPDEPLPKANDAAAAGRAAKEVAAKVLRIWIGIICTSGLIAFGAWRFWKSQ